MNWSIGKRRFWLNSRIASFWLARSCERVETRRQATVFKAASKKRSNGAYFGVLKTIVSRTLYSQLTSIKTDIIIDTWP